MAKKNALPTQKPKERAFLVGVEIFGEEGLLSIEDSLSELRKIMSKRAKKFIETMDQVISGYDRDINSSVKGKGRKQAGLGIYYFEEDQ